MPFYKIGEQAEPIAPATQMDQPRVSRQEIEDWFNNTILALQDDPYVHMDPDQEDYSELFRVLNTETNSADSILSGSTSIREYDFMQKELLFEKSLAGQLFYYDPTLDEYGGFRQLYTKQVMVDGKQDYKLFITDDLKALPKTEPTKPQHPGMWKYLFYPFFAGQFKEYKAQMKEYDAQMAKYAKITEMEQSLADEKYRLGEYVDERTNGRVSTTFVYARDIQAEKLEDYERTKPVEQNEAAQEQEKQQEQKENTVTRGLKSYDAHTVAKAMSHMTYDEKIVPVNTLGIDGAGLGALVTMALASPDLSIRTSETQRLKNDPDVNYEKAIDHHMKDLPISRKDRLAGFMGKAKNAVIDGMQAAGEGDYSLLGKLVAQGLTQNNKMLMGCRQLDDRFTTYANIGTRMLDLLNVSADLKKATLDALGGDSKQLDMANAAKNINNLRMEAMPLYETMLTQFGATVPKKYIDPKDGVEKVRYDNAAMGNTRDLAKVIQLFNIEVAMNAGNFDLQTTEYAKNSVVEKYNQELDKSSVLISFLAGENRVETLKDPMKMKDLYVNATNERKQVAEELKQAALEMNMEKQPKEKSSEVSMA